VPQVVEARGARIVGEAGTLAHLPPGASDVPALPVAAEAVLEERCPRGLVRRAEHHLAQDPAQLGVQRHRFGLVAVLVTLRRADPPVLVELLPDPEHVVLEVDVAAAQAGHCAPPGASQHAPITAFVTWIRTSSNSFNVLVDGGISAKSRIARIELQSSSSAVPLPLQQSYFIGELATVTSAGSMPAGANVLVGYNAGGREVARLDLNGLMESLNGS
jgi:hypothetical protein